MTYQQLSRRLAKIYGEGEAKAMARMVFEVRYGLTMGEILLMGSEELRVKSEELEEIAQRLERQEPIQYVLGEAEFGGRRFHVAPGVLIPRPETAELCQWIIDNGQLIIDSPTPNTKHPSPKILDIGTGSGCIAVTLAAEMPGAKVTAWDISEAALAIARENAQRHHVDVQFEQVDILEKVESLKFKVESSEVNSEWSIIVSNPPYVCEQEKALMEKNVLDYEPHTALFVPDDDPLLFYRAIADYALQALKPDGELYFELNPLYAQETAAMLKEKGYHDIEIKKDMFDKLRFVKCKN